MTAVTLMLLLLLLWLLLLLTLLLQATAQVCIAAAAGASCPVIFLAAARREEHSRQASWNDIQLYTAQCCAALQAGALVTVHATLQVSDQAAAALTEPAAFSTRSIISPCSYNLFYTLEALELRWCSLHRATYAALHTAGLAWLGLSCDVLVLAAVAHRGPLRSASLDRLLASTRYVVSN